MEEESGISAYSGDSPDDVAPHPYTAGDLGALRIRFAGCNVAFSGFDSECLLRARLSEAKVGEEQSRVSPNIPVENLDFCLRAFRVSYHQLPLDCKLRAVKKKKKKKKRKWGFLGFHVMDYLSTARSKLSSSCSFSPGLFAFCKPSSWSAMSRGRWGQMDRHGCGCCGRGRSTRGAADGHGFLRETKEEPETGEA
jgi:hypothetical protein